MNPFRRRPAPVVLSLPLEPVRVDVALELRRTRALLKAASEAAYESDVRRLVNQALGIVTVLNTAVSGDER